MGSNEDFLIHPSAIVDAGASIGTGTKIWHWTHISSGAQIGKNSVLGQNVFVASGTSIGSNVKIQNNVSIYEGVHLEDHVFVGPSVVFTNVINPRAEISRREEFKKTLVKKGATLGANSTILCGIEIGAYAFIAAGSVVTKSVRDYSLVVGSPARHQGWRGEFGDPLELLSSGKWICKATKRIYRESERGLCPEESAK